MLFGKNYDTNYMKKKANRLFGDLNDAKKYQEFWLGYKGVINELLLLLKDAQIKNMKNVVINGCAEWLIKRLESSSTEVERIMTNLKSFRNHKVVKIFKIHDIIFKNIAPKCDLYQIATGAAVNSIIAGNEMNHMSIAEIISNYTTAGSTDKIESILSHITQKNLEVNDNQNVEKEKTNDFNQGFGYRGRNRGRGGRGRPRGRGRGGRNNRGRSGYTGFERALQWAKFCANFNADPSRKINNNKICMDYNESSCYRYDCSFIHGCVGCGKLGHAVSDCPTIKKAKK